MYAFLFWNDDASSVANSVINFIRHLDAHFFLFQLQQLLANLVPDAIIAIRDNTISAFQLERKSKFQLSN